MKWLRDSCGWVWAAPVDEFAAGERGRIWRPRWIGQKTTEVQMQYDERELRLAFILAIVLSVFGCIAFALGIPFQQPRWIVGGFVLVALGLALGVKLRQVVRNDGREDE